ncbi:MAG: DoxX family membrane protein [Bacteroidetes bacterium]|jgi:putative oxidoreductase|nr:DoxX family membrane protein [Bacteroidota bacterium]
MKKLLTTNYNPRLLDIWLLCLRILVAAFMLTHGLPKFMKLIEGQGGSFISVLGMGAELSLAMAVFAEVGCSVLIGIGLFTRLASITLVITMLVAAFIAHGDDPFGKKEMALLYLLIYVTVLVAGSGRYSLDRLLSWP